MNTAETPAMVFPAPILQGGSVAKVPNGGGSTSFLLLPHVASGRGKQQTRADRIAAGVHIVAVVCCQRGDVFELDYSLAVVRSI